MLARSGGPSRRDTRVVTTLPQDRAMNVQLTCPWCEDEVAFKVDEVHDELVCSACDTRMAFAPDPVATFRLLYEAA
jgi:hypothetical protein